MYCVEQFPFEPHYELHLDKDAGTVAMTYDFRLLPQRLAFLDPINAVPRSMRTSLC
jgi:hypothetical protein